MAINTTKEKTINIGISPHPLAKWELAPFNHLYVPGIIAPASG